MPTPALTLAAVRKLRPCEGDMAAVEEKLRSFGRRKITARQAVDAGITFDDLVWVASAAALDNKDVERRLRLWMADCAARVLHIYERQAPGDARVRDAIVAARQYARGEIDDAAWAAVWAAARDAEEKRQFDRLVAWLSDPEPEELALPEMAQADQAAE